MREIKFKGKRRDNNEWITGSYVWYKNFKLGKVNFIVDDSGHYFRVNPDTVGQYWRTVNKQELYDGDIFEIRMFDDMPKWVVKYIEDEGQFCIAHPEELNLKFVNPWQKPNKEWWMDFGDSIYKIGNIHDNPELLIK